MIKKSHLICTIIAPNYLSQALVLGESLVQNMPEVAFRILILKDDEDNSVINGLLKNEDYLQKSNADHFALSLQEIDWENFDLLGAVNKYDLLEFATSVKPALIRHLLKEGWDRVTYLDPDIQVFNDFSALLSDANSISLTPHILQDFPFDGCLPDQQSILYAGTYNLGFISCRPNSLSFLNWWAWKLENFCTMEILDGYHVDQKWIDWAPGFCETQVLRDPGLNIAYWNLHERSVVSSIRENSVCFQGEVSKLYFYHFSGFDDFEKLSLSKHATRIFSASNIPNEFIQQYADRRKHWKDIIENSDWKFKVFVSKWTIGGRLGGVGNPAALRATLLQSDRSQIKSFDVNLPKSKKKQVNQLSGQSLEGPALGWLLRHLFSRKQLKDLSVKERQFVQDLGYTDSQISIGSKLANSFMEDLPRIKIVGYFAAPTGVGQIARNTASLLQRFGIPYTVEWVTTPFDSLLLKKRYQEKYLTPNGKEDVTLSFINADMWLLDGVESRKIDPNQQFVAAVWAWEVESIPAHFKQVASNVDQLFALSKFSALALEESIGKPVKVFPTYLPELEFPNRLGASRSELYYAIPQLPKKYVLCRFDAKSVIKRKNPEGVIEVWGTVSNEFPDYALVIKATDLIKIGSAKLLTMLSTAPSVYLIDRDLDEDLNNSLMVHASAYISLHRAEGLGLNVLEAIFADVPAIFTSYSGLSDELRQIGFHVNYELTKIGENANPYPPKGQWAEPDIDHAVKQLRTALTQVESGQWKAESFSRGEWITEFLALNEKIAINEVTNLINSVSLVENRFDRFNHHRGFILHKLLLKIKLNSLLPLWKKLPIGVRQKWKPIILRMYFILYKRDANLKHWS
jgi:glycosyltransferase involved in cell wall biosynthesis